MIFIKYAECAEENKSDDATNWIRDMRVERDDCINFAEMSYDETHVVTLLSVALHYGIVPEREENRY